jgi:hypothetical protein
MQQIKRITNGSRQVVICHEGERVVFARLFVNNGETATPTETSAKTLKGAEKWAGKILARYN